MTLRAALTAHLGFNRSARPLGQRLPLSTQLNSSGQRSLIYYANLGCLEKLSQLTWIVVISCAWKSNR